MSDHIKTSEQREEERRAGALDSTKDQALSKDSLQHVPATAGRTEIIAAAADIQAARHSVATGPATASSSTPDRGELDQEQDGLPPTSDLRPILLFICLQALFRLSTAKQAQRPTTTPTPPWRRLRTHIA